MASYSDEDYVDEYDYEDYCNTGKCSKFINNTSAVKPVGKSITTKKPVVRVKPVKNIIKAEKPVIKQLEEKKQVVEVVDCWEDLL